MTATNHTKNYNLSQFTGNDRSYVARLTASELDSMYKDANGIVRVGHTAE